MKFAWRDVALVSAWAVGSAGLTLLVTAPAMLHADGPQTAIGAPANVPTLSIGPVQFTFVPAADPAAAYAAGSKAELVILARNTSNRAATVQLGVEILSRAPASPMSRVPFSDVSTWHQDRWVSVPAGEETRLTFASDELAKGFLTLRLYELAADGTRSASVGIPLTSMVAIDRS